MTSSPDQIYERQSPRFNADSDPIAYALHLAFVSDGYQLVGLDDDVGAGDRSYEGLPGTWNNNPDLYTFRYRHHDLLIVVKCLVVDQSLIIHANRSGSDSIVSLDLVIPDHLQSPHDLHQPSAVYSSLQDLVALITDRVVQQFQPTAAKTRSEPNFNAFDFEDEDQDPMRVPRRPIRPRGDFDQDLIPSLIDPFHPESGGSYMGPDHPMFTRGRGRGRGRIPRFDPFGPDRGFSGDPNRDIFMPPGFGGGSGAHFPF